MTGVGISLPMSPGGLGAAGISADMLMQFETGSPGDLITATTLNALRIAANADKWTWTTPTRAPQHTTIDNVNMPRLNPLVCNNAIYTGSGTRGMQLSETKALSDGLSPLYEVLQAAPPGTITDLSVSFMLNTSLLSNTVDTNFDIVNIGSFFYAVAQLVTTGGGGGAHYNPKIRAHGETGGGSTRGGYVTLTYGTTYAVTLRHNYTSSKVEVVVLDGTTGAFVGASTCPSTLGNVNYVLFQDYLLLATGTSGLIQFDNIAFRWKSSPPVSLDPFTMPAVTALIAAQTASGQITITWTAAQSNFKIEQSHNGGAYTTLVAENDGSMSYIDTGLTPGDTYQYRITPVVSEVIGSDAVSNSVMLTAGPSWVYNTTSFNDTRALTSTDVTSSAITLPAGQITKLAVNLATVPFAHDMKLGLFDSVTRALLVSGTLSGDSSTGWVEVTVAPYTVAAGTYLIGHVDNSSGMVGSRNTAVGTNGVAGVPYFTLSNPLPADYFTQAGVVGFGAYIG